MEKDEIVRLAWNMDRLVGLRRSLINREADENGIYLGQHRVLRYIVHNPGCSQRDIATALSQTPAAITLSTKRLQEMGMITKETDPKNLRRYHLYVTDKGVQNGESFFEVITRYAGITFEDFSDEDLEKLSELIEKMYLNLKPYKTDVCVQETQTERGQSNNE